MKKFALLIPVALLSFTLAACGNSKSADNSSSSSSTSATSTTGKTNPSSSTTTSASSSSVSTASKQVATSNAATSSSKSNSSTRLENLNQQLTTKLGNVSLPQADGLDQGSNNLNIRYTGSSANYQIFYSVGNHPVAFNDASLSQQNPFAVLQKQTFSSKADAANQINYLPASGNKGLPTVSLSKDITGYKDQGAGNIHLLWNEGRWSLSVHASNIANQDPIPLAKQTISLLDQYFLPAPKTIGQVSFDVNIEPGARDQIISWQDGISVYSLTAHDPATAIKMVASIK